jgi:large subunit ribosomal protein L25
VKENRLKAFPREDTGKGAARRLRADGYIPGVVYGEGADPRSLYVSNYDFVKMVSKSASRNILVDLEFEGDSESRKVLIKDIQMDPVTSKVVSIDLLMISMDKLITMSVPISLVGTSDGVQNMGGIMEFLHREVDISCLPGDIPEKIELDVSEMKIGDTLHFEDLSADQFTVLSNPRVSICTVVAPTVIKEPVAAVVEGEEEAEGEEAAAAAEAAPEDEQKEPEVIKEKKEEK